MSSAAPLRIWSYHEKDRPNVHQQGRYPAGQADTVAQERVQEKEAVMASQKDTRPEFKYASAADEKSSKSTLKIYRAGRDAIRSKIRKNRAKRASRKSKA